MRFLCLSPHYFYNRDIQREDARNRLPRQILADELIELHLTSRSRVLDYGCGPGYLAAAVAEKAAYVDAVDISRGVLACAKVLNGRPNITYWTPAELWAMGEMADVACSFAVIQHLRTETLEQVLSLLARSVRSGGVLLLHFAVPDPVLWRTEKQWRCWIAGGSGQAALRPQLLRQVRERDGGPSNQARLHRRDGPPAERNHHYSRR